MTKRGEWDILQNLGGRPRGNRARCSMWWLLLFQVWGKFIKAVAQLTSQLSRRTTCASTWSSAQLHQSMEIWPGSPSSGLLTLGIGLVWDILSYPYPTFYYECWNLLQTELNYLWWDLSCSQDDIRCFKMFPDVFSWVVTLNPLCDA